MGKHQKVSKVYDNDCRFFYQKKTNFKNFVSLSTRPILPKTDRFVKKDQLGHMCFPLNSWSFPLQLSYKIAAIYLFINEVAVTLFHFIGNLISYFILTEIYYIPEFFWRKVLSKLNNYLSEFFKPFYHSCLFSKFLQK